MKTTLKYFIAALVAVVAVVGCKEEQWDSAKWKAENELYFTTLSASKTYEVLEPSKGNTLLIKKIAFGPTEGVAPKPSSTVACHYRGWNKNKEVFDQSFEGDAPTSTDKPLYAQPNQLIPGFAYALTQMRVGDHCEVVIPWKLAYGAKGAGAIRPYSTLHFELILVEVVTP